MNIKLIVTDDGSHTLRVDELSEHYHSTFGAINESRHVFIDAGLHRIMETGPRRLSILEVGFGTGLNALLTLLDDRAGAFDIEYIAVEAFPLERKIWSKLNYADLLGEKETEMAFEHLHSSGWGETVQIKPGFRLKKIACTLETFITDRSFDLVYFDAFGPDVQPELWTGEIFLKIAGMTRSGGILVTYSCKGSVKRGLKAAGFHIEKLPGPRGKREMLRGIKL